MVGDSQTSASEVSVAKEEESKEVVKNTKSKLKMFSGFMPYYGKEFSFCQLTCSDNSTEQICFIEKGKLVLITNQGKLYHCQIDGLKTKFEPAIEIFKWISWEDISSYRESSIRFYINHFS